MQNLSATAEEVLAVVREMFPTQLDRAIAELTIRKQEARIDELESQLADRIDEAVGHKHPHADAA